MLAARALSAAEVQRRLLRKGHSKASADLAVQGLLEVGLINDGDFARHYARTRARRQRFGPRRLVADLKRMGVKDQVAVAAGGFGVNTLQRPDLAGGRVAEHVPGVDAGDMLRDAAARKVRTLKGVDTETARRRLRAYLLRRGFSGREVIAVVKDALPR
jgi:regulatory protein